VTNDGLAQREPSIAYYAMIAVEPQRQTLVTEFYRANQPFERANKETVQVT